MSELQINLKSQELVQDENGYNTWRSMNEQKSLPAPETALLLCDVWDHHWCRGARDRLDAMLERMNEVVHLLREKGVAIIHAPSGTMDFYTDNPAQQRIVDTLKVGPPPDLEHDDPPQPVDSSDHGSDTGETDGKRTYSRQNAGIDIDPERDGISDDGREVYSFIQHRGIKNLIICGVHTNMCILNRSFAIKQMMRWGVNVALIRDLTDSMYNPAMAPYVSHDEGTQLVIEYIEKFWCPTTTSGELLSVA